MKRYGIRCMLFLLALFLILPLGPLQAGAAGNALSIDSENKYTGMDKSYAEGYMPSVSGGVAIVVLPLVSSTAIVGNSVSITLEYGDAQTSPFVFSNLQKSVALSSNQINGGASTKSGYLVSLSLPLQSDRVNGRYPLGIQVSYTTADGANSQTFTVYVTIADGVNPNATPQPSAAETQPKIIVSEYHISPSNALAGEDFSVKVTLKNTSGSKGVRNMKIAYKGETNDLLPSGSSNTVFIDSLGAGKTSTVTLKMKVGLDAQPKPQRVLLSIEYESGSGAAYSSNEEIPIEIHQPNRISYDPPSIPTQINAGDTIPVSLNVFNMGKNTLNNVMCTVQAQGLLPEGSAFLGNMESGASKTAQIYVFVGTKDMVMTTDGVSIGADETKNYGPISGMIHLSYEDSYGESYNQDIPFSTIINPPARVAATAQPVAAQPKASQWWISVLIAAVLLAGAFVAFALVKRSRRKRVSDYDLD